MSDISSSVARTITQNPIVKVVPGRDSAAADQFSTPTVDLKLTTGSLWARNEEESRAAFAERNPSREIDDLRNAMIEAEQHDSLIHNPDLKKAALAR